MPYKKPKDKITELAEIAEILHDHTMNRDTEDPRWWFRLFDILGMLEEWKGDLNDESNQPRK